MINDAELRTVLNMVFRLSTPAVNQNMNCIKVAVEKMNIRHLVLFTAQK